MAVSTGTSILARARTTASQTAGDANLSPIIDSLGGARALLNNAIRQVYRDKANQIRFRQDIAVSNAVTITSGTGTVPANLMREWLGEANISNSSGDLISWMDFPVDAQSGETFNQLGYLYITGLETLNYIAPSPTLATYTGTLTIQCPSFPTFPASLSSNITFQSTSIIDDVVLALASAITGQLDWQNTVKLASRKKEA